MLKPFIQTPHKCGTVASKNMHSQSASIPQSDYFSLFRPRCTPARGLLIYRASWIRKEDHERQQFIV